MALLHSTALKTYDLASGIATAFDTTGQLRIYTGTKPASADTAPSGTLITTHTLAADAFGTPAAGVVTANAIGSAAAAANGTLGWFRLQLSGDAGTTNTTDRRLDGTVTLNGAGGDLTFDNTTVTAGQTVTITALTYTHPI